jgi:hypothetical protein
LIGYTDPAFPDVIDPVNGYHKRLLDPHKFMSRQEFFQSGKAHQGHDFIFNRMDAEIIFHSLNEKNILHCNPLSLRPFLQKFNLLPPAKRILPALFRVAAHCFCSDIFLVHFC